MNHLEQQRLTRQLVRVKRHDVQVWGCSECEWLFASRSPPIGQSLSEMMTHFEIQLSEAFESHTCLPRSGQMDN